MNIEFQNFFNKLLCIDSILMWFGELYFQNEYNWDTIVKEKIK